jgi:hypothetical protein
MVILLELSEDGMVRRMPDPLNYGSFREWCRHRLGLGPIGAGAYDPSPTLAVHCGMGFDADFSPYQSTRLRR